MITGATWRRAGLRGVVVDLSGQDVEVRDQGGTFTAILQDEPGFELGGDVTLARTARDGFGATDTFFEQSIERIRGTDQRDVIIGNSLENELRGEGGDDLIRAGGGNDELVGGAGADNLQGGDGFDEVDYLRDANFEGGNQGVIVNLSGGDNPSASRLRRTGPRTGLATPTR